MIYLEGDPPEHGHPILALVYVDANGAHLNVTLSETLLTGDPEDGEHWERTFKPALCALRNMLDDESR